VTQIEEYGRFVPSLMPKLAADENRLAREIYNALATIGAVSVDRLAEGTGFAPSRVEAILSPWPGVYREDRGDIIEFWALTARPISKHVLRINGHTSYAWCAWDCLFLPALLRRSMQVTSVCAQTGDAIELLVSPSSVERSSRLRQCCQCSVQTWSRPARHCLRVLPFHPLFQRRGCCEQVDRVPSWYEHHHTRPGHGAGPNEKCMAVWRAS